MYQLCGTHCGCGFIPLLELWLWTTAGCQAPTQPLPHSPSSQDREKIRSESLGTTYGQKETSLGENQCNLLPIKTHLWRDNSFSPQGRGVLPFSQAHLPSYLLLSRPRGVQEDGRLWCCLRLLPSLPLFPQEVYRGNPLGTLLPLCPRGWPGRSSPSSLQRSPLGTARPSSAEGAVHEAPARG